MYLLFHAFHMAGPSHTPYKSRSSSLNTFMHCSRALLWAGHVGSTTNTRENRVKNTEHFSLKSGGDRSRVFPRVLLWILYVC